MVKFANNLKIPQETTASSLVPETAAMKKGRTFPSPAHMHSFFFFPLILQGLGSSLIILLYKIPLVHDEDKTYAVFQHAVL